MIRKHPYWLGAVLIVLGMAGITLWRSAHRQVTVEFPIVAVPSLTIAVNALQIETLPGVTQRLVYRVTNPDTQPQRLIVNLQVEPEEAEDWLRIFQTDCRKWVLIKPGETIQLDTVFAVVPSLIGTPSHVTVRSVFQTL